MNVEKFENYVVIEFDDDDIDDDVDIKFINKLIKNDVEFEFVDDDENIIKIYQ